VRLPTSNFVKPESCPGVVSLLDIEARFGVSAEAASRRILVISVRAVDFKSEGPRRGIVSWD
jgi:hypothetical protein